MQRPRFMPGETAANALAAARSVQSAGIHQMLYGIRRAERSRLAASGSGSGS